MSLGLEATWPVQRSNERSKLKYKIMMLDITALHFTRILRTPLCSPVGDAMHWHRWSKYGDLSIVCSSGIRFERKKRKQTRQKGGARKDGGRGQWGKKTIRIIQTNKTEEVKSKKGWAGKSTAKDSFSPVWSVTNTRMPLGLNNDGHNNHKCQILRMSRKGFPSVSRKGQFLVFISAMDKYWKLDSVMVKY